MSIGSSGPPETVLPAADPAITGKIAAALSDSSREDLVAVGADHPESLDVWAAMGDSGRDTLESYAYYRVGYHRGLDALRRSGWRGSGYVRWENESNRAFLRCLSGLRRCAAEIGEDDEAERCGVFLLQLDPSWPPNE